MRCEMLKRRPTCKRYATLSTKGSDYLFHSMSEIARPCLKRLLRNARCVMRVASCTKRGRSHDMDRHNFEIALSVPDNQNSLRQRRIATRRSEEVERTDDGDGK